MSLSRTAAAVVGTAALAVTGVAAPAAAAPADAPTSTTAPTGTTSLAEVLAADGADFDRNPFDYDILDGAVRAVLAAKPDSPVAVLADGSVPLTAFLPDDLAFRLLLLDVAHQAPRSEEAVLNGLATAVGVDAVETVLLYHVVPGATIDSATALASDGADLTTAQGGTFQVDVLSTKGKVVRLKDADRNDIDPFLDRRDLDLNAGNAQIAHGISFVLRPADL
ncbi:fasciclin domain-containing protein [Thalassiella azotivora]